MEPRPQPETAAWSWSRANRDRARPALPASLSTTPASPVARCSRAGATNSRPQPRTCPSSRHSVPGSTHPVTTNSAQPSATAGAELARLAPELASRIGPFPEGPELSASEQRLRLYDGVARCLFNLAGSGGLLLFVDDLQWADQASLEPAALPRSTCGQRTRPRPRLLSRDRTRPRPPAGRGARQLEPRASGGPDPPPAFRTPAATKALLSVLLGDECLNDEFCETSTAKPRATPSLSRRWSRPWSKKARSSVSTVSGGGARRGLTWSCLRASRRPSDAVSITCRNRPPTSCAPRPSSARPSTFQSSRRWPTPMKTSSSMPSMKRWLRSCWRQGPAKTSSSPTTRFARCCTTS